MTPSLPTSPAAPSTTVSDFLPVALSRMTTASRTPTQGNAMRMNMRAVAFTQPTTETVDPNTPWTSPTPAAVSSTALRSIVFPLMDNLVQDTHPGSSPQYASASTTPSSSRTIVAATTTSISAQVTQMSSTSRASGSEVTNTTASTTTSTLSTLPRSRRFLIVGTSTSIALPSPPILVPAPSPSSHPLYLHLPPTSLKKPDNALPLAPSSASSSSNSASWSSSAPASSLSSSSLSFSTTILATKRKSATTAAIADDSDASPPPTKVTMVSRRLSPSSKPSDQKRMKRLPSEVLLVVARFLELKDVMKCMIVCKSWHHALCLIPWNDIGRVQWRKVTFPLNDMKVDEDDNESFSHRLRQVRKLVWDERFNVAMTSERIAAMLRLMPGLTDLSLTASVFRPPRALLGLLKNLRILSRLKSLHLHFSNFQGEDALPINQVIHGCHDLEFLSVNGRFREETQEELDAHPQPWSLTSLSVPRTHLGLLQRCPELRALELSSHPNIDVEINLQPITRCPRLERLKFVGPDGFIVSDFEAVVPTMRCLTSLCIEHIRQHQFGSLEPLREISNIPGLKELELGRVTIHGEELLTMANQLMIVGILRGRPNLRKFALKGFTIDAVSFFTVMEDGHSVPSCPCSQLHELWVEIHAVESSQNAMERIWELVYRHIARIGGLESLTLRSAHLDVSPSAGFNLLANAGKLRELKLSNLNGRCWTAAEMQLLMTVAPHLKSLDLSPAINRGNVNGWLRLNGKAYLIK